MKTKLSLFVLGLLSCVLFSSMAMAHVSIHVGIGPWFQPRYWQPVYVPVYENHRRCRYSRWDEFDEGRHEGWEHEHGHHRHEHERWD